jgi:hypothetical protein
MRSEVCSEVRTQELTATPRTRRFLTQGDRRARDAGSQVLETYRQLARDGRHMLQPLLDGQNPVQWRHYPPDDAVDAATGYQWFYHSHSPQDRAGSGEHGHFHLFARRPIWARRLCSERERAFAALTGNPDPVVQTRHLLGLGLDPRGVPVSLFTVNSWVTGDLMLSAGLTGELLAGWKHASGYAQVDTVLAGILAVFRDEILDLLAERDASLRSRMPGCVLGDRTLEVLSERAIDASGRLAQLCGGQAARGPGFWRDGRASVR